MSYLGRVGQRASAPMGRALAAAPSGRLSSPLARLDQRLNWIGDAEMPAAPSAFARPGARDASDPTLEAGDSRALRDPSMSRSTPALRESSEAEPGQRPAARSTAPRESVVAGTGRRSAVDVGPRPIESSSIESSSIESSSIESSSIESSSIESSPSVPQRQTRSVSESAPTVPPRVERTAIEQPPSQRSAQHAEPVVRWESVTRESVDSKAPAGAKAAVSVEAKKSGEAKSSPEASKSPAPTVTAESVARAMSEAMGKIERWMQKPAAPKPRPPASSVPGATPQSPALRQIAQNVPRGRALPQPERRAPAPARLTIGHIDVQVVPPPPAPVAPVPRAAKQTPRSTTTSTSSVSPLSHISFGLGQR